MSKLKGLQTLAEAATDGQRLAKAAGRAVDTLNPPPAGTMGALSNLDEYQQAAGRLDSDTPVEQVAQEVLKARETAAEAHRIKVIASDSVTADFNAQARTPEEFRGRVTSLARPETSIDAMEKGNFAANIKNPLDSQKNTSERYVRWLDDQEHIRSVVTNNREVMDWAGQGAYTRGAVYGDDVEHANEPIVWFRMDIKQDPRAGLTPIQFDANANEFGMHIGSRSAGQDIISPEVRATNDKRVKQVRAMFDDLSVDLADQLEGLDVGELFDQALSEVRTNAFLRYGESAFDEPSLELINEIIDDFFGELKFAGEAAGIQGFKDLPAEAALKTRLRSLMRTSMDPLQHPVMTDVKQGLLVQDLGPGNTAGGIAENLIGRGIFDDDELQAISGMATNAERNIALRDLVRSGGYDHLVYVNEAEDAGVMSIVLFDEKNYENLYKPTRGRKGQPSGHQAKVQALLAPLALAIGGGNAALRGDQ